MSKHAGSSARGVWVTAHDATDPARGNQHRAGATSPVTVTGLTNGDSYTFTVRATNKVAPALRRPPRFR